MYLLISSYILDVVFGDPEWIVHPVREIGKLINNLERILRGTRSIWVERVKGGVLAILVIVISSLTAYLLLRISKEINIILGNIVWIYTAYTTLSVRDLRVKATKIFSALEDNNIRKARENLSKIVGRDTDNLSQAEIIKAAVESVAESTNDGIVAPLFYLILGGPVLAVAYKAINTLDSMIGYKDEKYIHFGWFTAHLDDIANYIPARICGFLISISSFAIGESFIASLKTMFKDGRNHPSPNSGISEAAMAGALGVRLGGGSFYDGIFDAKPYIGTQRREISNNLILEAMRISFVTSILMLSIGVLFKWIT